MNVEKLTPFGGPAAWKGSEIDYHQDGLHLLTAEEIDEVDAALRQLKSEGELDLPSITKANFRLPKLSGTLQRIADELRYGRGFVLIRGLPRERYSMDDLARIYYGIGINIGQVIPQSGDGELLGHVMNVSDFVDEPVRGYRSSQSMNMHSDGFDVVGLLCLQSAKVGGASRIASAVAVHDRMVEQRPDLVAELYRGMKIRRMQKDADHGNGLTITRDPVALFAQQDGEFLACIHAAQVRDAAAAGAFEMSDKQSEALDMLCGLAASPEFYLDMNIGEGDIQFLSNRVILHGRSTYEDYPELERRRHLMRLWLNIPSWPARPANQQDIYALDDLPNWARYRTSYMEFPSRYMDGIRESGKRSRA